MSTETASAAQNKAVPPKSAQVERAPKAQTIDAGNLVVVDLGKKKRRQLRNLRKGRGRLMSKVSDVVSDLRAEGALATDGASVVVVVVERRRRKKRSGRGWF